MATEHMLYIYNICCVVYGVWVCVFACVRLRVIASGSLCVRYILHNPLDTVLNKTL